MSKRGDKEEWLKQFEFDSLLDVYRRDGIEFSNEMVCSTSLPELKSIFNFEKAKRAQK